MRLSQGRKTIILMLDGFGLDYYEQAEMPVLRRMAREGFFSPGKAIFPTLTNANNISIVCGAFPETHGVTTNCYLDPATGRPAFLEEPGFLKSPTLFAMAARAGMRSALVTAKAKTVGILGGSVAIGLAAQGATAATVRDYGSPPDMYSVEINEWILRSGLRILRDHREIDVLYVHTTDYPMHMWAPDDERSLDHMARLDRLLADLVDCAPDAAFLVTADHGMNAKQVCLDLEVILRDTGFPVRAVISPVADRLVKHHGGHGGVAYVYLADPSTLGETIDFLRRMQGVDTALPADEAAARFRLDRDRIGDIVVGADAVTVFGNLGQERQLLPPAYRNHGSRFEEDIPLIAWNTDLGASDGLRYNLDLTRTLFFP